MADDVTHYDAVEAYCDRLSYAAGDEVHLHTWCATEQYDVSVSRWGADGPGAPVWSTTGLAGAQQRRDLGLHGDVGAGNDLADAERGFHAIFACFCTPPILSRRAALSKQTRCLTASPIGAVSMKSAAIALDS